MQRSDSGQRLSVSEPFLKWAGGKRWLIQRFPDLIPDDIKNYFEPFLGSGAVYFHVRPNGGTISDLNQDLVATYAALRDDPKGVKSALKKHSSRKKSFGRILLSDAGKQAYENV